MHPPPLLVITAECDPLREKSEFYAGKLTTAGVATTLTHNDGVNHGFMSWVGVVDKAGAAMSEACEWLRRPAHERDQRERKRGGNRSNFSGSVPVLGPTTGSSRHNVSCLN